MQNANTPLVSIGVPVYNGEKLLAKALSALLEQDYTNLEIIISNNGSTDDTAKICKEVAKKDRRVRYYHSKVNRGAPWNFNRVVELSKGKYFMWAAHDDLREPTFVSSCVGKLEQWPEAVLCQTKTSVLIDQLPNPAYTASLDSFVGHTDQVQRYRETLKNFPATAIYGMYRLSVMKKTRLFENVVATDLAFIQELSIYGPFIQVNEVLFYYVGRAKRNTVDMDFKFFFGGEKKPFWYLPFIVLFRNHLSRVSSSSVPRIQKIRFFWELIKHQFKQIFLKICIKLLGKICPSAWRMKVGLFIYWRFMSNPNEQVETEDLFLTTMIKPKLRWWPR